MHLQALKHLAEAVHSLTQCETICVLGSASLLPVFPELGRPGGSLELSYDADFLISPSNEKTAAMVHEAVGEGSLFSEKNGYYADLLRPEIKETLPQDWERRIQKIEAAFELNHLHPLDLAVVKLQAGRKKDLDLLEQLLELKLLGWSEIKEHLDRTPLLEATIYLCNQRLASLRKDRIHE